MICSGAIGRLVTVIALLSPMTAVAGQPKFTNVTQKVGIDPTHSASPGSLTAGAAFFDWDNDGWSDLFITQELSPCVLLRNQGPPDFTFEDVSVQAGLADKLLGACCVVAADFTGDKIVDLVMLTSLSDVGLIFLAGRPDGTFVDETPVRVTAPASRYLAMGAADPDGDGDLDLVAVRHSTRRAPPVDADDCLESHVFENQGGSLVWKEGALNDLAGCGLAAVFTDFDDDGDVDIVQVNDFGPFYQPNVALRNDGVLKSGQWVFTKDTPEAEGLNTAVYGMGMAVGDINGDLIRDYFVTSFGEDALLMGQAGGGFVDATDLWRAGSILNTTKRKVKWGALILDADNDGHEDLFVAAGWLYAWPQLTEGPQRTVFLRNTGTPPLEEYSKPAGFDLTSQDRTLIAGDYNRDGLMDVVLASIDVSLLMKNESVDTGNWLAVVLNPTVSNPRSVGAKLIAKCGTISRLREIMGGEGPGGTSEPLVHFGLGTCSGPVDVSIRWPSGRFQKVDDAPINTFVKVTEPQWYSVSQNTAPADGITTVTLTYEHDNDTTVQVNWKSSLGTTDDGMLKKIGPKTYIGILTAPATPGEAIISLNLDGKLLPAHPKVHFTPTQPVQWSIWPANAFFNTKVRVGLRVTDTEGQPIGGTVSMTVDGGDLQSGVKVVNGLVGAVWSHIMPHAGVNKLIVQAKVDGTAYGKSLTIPLGPLIDPKRSRFRISPQWSGGTSPDAVKVTVNALTPEGWPAPYGFQVGQTVTLPITITRNGVPIATTPTFLGSLMSMVAYTTEAALGGPGKYQITVDNVTIEQSAHINPSNAIALANQVSTQYSVLQFFDQHLHADGEDLVPIFFTLQDKHEQTLPQLTPDMVSFETENCTVLTETLWYDEVGGVFTGWALVQVTNQEGTATAKLNINGLPTGLTAVVDVHGPSPYTADMSLIEALFLSPTEPIGYQNAIPADGTSQVRVRISPIDVSGNLTGSGIGLSLVTDGGSAEVPVYNGLGVYDIFVTAPPVPCTATFTITADTGVGAKTTTYPFTQADGTIVETPCSDFLPPDPEPDPEVADVVEAPPDVADDPPIEDVVDTTAADDTPSPDTTEPPVDTDEPDTTPNPDTNTADDTAADTGNIDTSEPDVPDTMMNDTAAPDSGPVDSSNAGNDTENTPPKSNNGGCGCRVSTSRPPLTGAAAVVLFALVLARLRRRYAV